uniref:Cystatin kininogen-type domain-containing protein n=1 Tax=Denticeps clupeoides TaxID=299321 RepID=A0AAY4EFV3_9TELE
MAAKKVLSVLAACLSCLFWAGGWAQEEVSLFCDDKSVQEAVDLALVEYNQMLTSGNLYALYQIHEAKQAKNESRTELSMRFTSRETLCPIGGDKQWRDCEYLPSGSKDPKTCESKILVTGGRKELLFVDCLLERVTSSRATCLGCPEDINVKSEDLKVPLSYSLGKANSMHDDLNLFILNTIGSASRQVVAGFRYRLKFDMQRSNCTKKDFSEVTPECHPHEEKMFVHCNSTVDVAPWRHEAPEGHVICVYSRRRPPGWSPLRNMRLVTTPPPLPVKTDRSSEESQEGNATPNPLSFTTTALEKSFNCPSKEWKEFVPVEATPPTNPSLSAPPSISPGDGAFSDLDLLQ